MIWTDLLILLAGIVLTLTAGWICFQLLPWCLMWWRSKTPLTRQEQAIKEQIWARLVERLDRQEPVKIRIPRGRG